MACLCQQSGGGGGSLYSSTLERADQFSPSFTARPFPPQTAPLHQKPTPGPQLWHGRLAAGRGTSTRAGAAPRPAARRLSGAAAAAPRGPSACPAAFPARAHDPPPGLWGRTPRPEGPRRRSRPAPFPPPPITDWHLPARGGRAAPASSSPPPKQRLQRRRRRRPLPASPGLASAPAAAQALQSPAAAALLASLPDDAAAASPVPVSPSRLAASHHSPERRAHPRRSPSGASSWFGLSATPAAGSYHLAHRGGKEAAGENAPGAGGGSGVSRGALSLGFVAGWP